jgi:small subunit ribosomal protein S17
MPIKTKIAFVISNKMNKTLVVNFITKYSHSVYSKIMIRSKKYFVHDENNECNIGDKILIAECRPLSKKKRWALIKKISTLTIINQD